MFQTSRSLTLDFPKYLKPVLMYVHIICFWSQLNFPPISFAASRHCISVEEIPVWKVGIKFFLVNLKCFFSKYFLLFLY